MRILTINSGSSSIKFGLYDIGASERLLFSGSLERIGIRAGTYRIKDSSDQFLVDEHIDLPDHEVAMQHLFSWLEKHESGQRLDGVGHRVVHGGPKYYEPQRITPELIREMRQLVHMAPDHLPHEIKAIQIISRNFPDLRQVACFDTAFHRHMPRLAQILALPRHYQNEGLMRFGFHGLSYEYIVQELRREAGDEVADGRLIIAHLGNGASMAAVLKGSSVDTTMGFTPVGGLMMSTRTGDLDPGVMLYLVEEKGLNPSVLNRLVNQESGLLGVSGISSDMKDLLKIEANEPHASEAINLFCYLASKNLAAMAAALGGLDSLIFTAGIGEHSPIIRQRICQNLSFMGITVDAQRNHSNSAIISPDNSPVTVRVMKTDEDLMIARHTLGLLGQKQ